jgi:hypothetical protein
MAANPIRLIIIWDDLGEMSAVKSLHRRIMRLAVSLIMSIRDFREKHFRYQFESSNSAFMF